MGWAPWPPRIELRTSGSRSLMRSATRRSSGVTSRLVGLGSAVARINNSVLGAMRHKAAWTSADQEPVVGFEALCGQKYALLTTYRNNGDAVPTPIWFGLDDDGALYFYTDETSGKVKRLHNNAQVRLAPCDLRGKPRGAPAVGSARILPADETDRAERVIAANYGFGRRIYDGAISRLPVTGVYVEVRAVVT
jgi:uncharacterized protein